MSNEVKQPRENALEVKQPRENALEVKQPRENTLVEKAQKADEGLIASLVSRAEIQKYLDANKQSNGKFWGIVQNTRGVDDKDINIQYEDIIFTNKEAVAVAYQRKITVDKNPRFVKVLEFNSSDFNKQIAARKKQEESV